MEMPLLMSSSGRARSFRSDPLRGSPGKQCWLGRAQRPAPTGCWLCRTLHFSSRPGRSLPSGEPSCRPSPLHRLSRRWAKRDPWWQQKHFLSQRAISPVHLAKRTRCSVADEAGGKVGLVSPEEISTMHDVLQEEKRCFFGCGREKMWETQQYRREPA